jgi:uncharacterized protein involved in outer membrane biogenesis
VDLTVKQGGSSVHITGGIADVLGLKDYDLKLSATGSSIPEALGHLDLPSLPEIGPFQVSAALSDKEGKVRLDRLDVQAGSEAVARVSVSGRVHDLVGLKQVDLRFNAQGADAANLTKTGLPFLPLRQAFKVSGRIIDQEEKTYAVKELQVGLGKETITGNLGLRLGPERPRLTVDLSARELFHGPFHLTSLLEGPVKTLSVDKLDLRMGAGETAELILRGGVKNVSTQEGMDLFFLLQGKDLANLEKITGKSLPVQGSFSASGNLRAPRPKCVEITGLQAALGENDFVGSGELDLTGEKPSVTVQLASQSVSLRKVLKRPVSWPAGLNTLPDLGPLQLYVEGSAAGESVAMEQLKVRAGSEKLVSVEVDGSIQEPRKLSGVSLRFMVRGTDSTKLAKLVGHSIPVAGPFALSGHLKDPAPQTYEAGDLTIDVGKNRINGKAKMDLSAGPPRIETQLSSQRLNLQQLSLGPLFHLSRISDLGPMKLEAALVIQEQGPAMEKLDLAMGTDELATVILKGTVGNLAPLQGVALAVAIKGKDVSGLEKITGTPLPLQGAYAISGTVNAAESGRYRLGDLNIRLGENNLIGAMELDLSPQSPSLSAELSSQRFSLQPLSFSKTGWVDRARMEDLGPMEFKVKLTGPAEQLSVRQLDISLGRETFVAARLQGVAENIPKREGINIRFDLRGTELKNLEKVIGHQIRQPGSFSASGQLATPSPNVFVVKDLKAVWADSDLNGDAKIDLAGKRPTVSAALTSRKLDMRPFLGYDGEPSAEKERKPPGAKRDKVFSGEPIPFDQLPQVDANVKFQAGQVFLPKLASQNTLFQVTLQKGKLEFTQMKFQVGKGRAEGTFAVRAQGKKGDIKALMTVQELDMGVLFALLKRERVVEGSLDTNVNLSTTGGSVAELMAGLNGRVDLVMGKGRASNKYMNLLGLEVGTKLFELISPHKKDSQYATINCLVERIDVEKGVANHKLLLDTDQTTLVSAGQVDLRTEGLNINIKSSPKKGLGIAGIAQLSIGLGELTKPFKLGGTLAKPTLAIDATQSTLAIGKTLGGIALFGPLGVVGALTDVSLGGKETCVEAMGAAQKETEQIKNEQKNSKKK